MPSLRTMSTASSSRSGRSGRSGSRNSAIVRYDTPEAEAEAEDPPSRRRRRDDTDDDDEHNEDMINRLTTDCVRYLLHISHKKTVIKRADMLKAVVKRQTLPVRAIQDKIIAKVRTDISRIYAIELVDCPDSPNTYILVNKLPADGLREVIDRDSIPDSQYFRSALLTAVLSVILMSSEQSCPEDLMWKFLERLGYDVKSKSTVQVNDDSSSNVTLKKLLTELWVRQMYVKYVKMGSSDPVVHEFQWGFRAHREFSQMDVLKFVCDVSADGSQPEYWRLQYQAINNTNHTNGVNDGDIDRNSD